MRLSKIFNHVRPAAAAVAQEEYRFLQFKPRVRSPQLGHFISELPSYHRHVLVRKTPTT